MHNEKNVGIETNLGLLPNALVRLRYEGVPSEKTNVKGI